MEIKLPVETTYQLEEYEGTVICSAKCKMDEANCFSKEMKLHPRENTYIVAKPMLTLVVDFKQRERLQVLFVGIKACSQNEFSYKSGPQR